MKQFKCIFCGHETIVKDDILVVICRFCQEKMIKMEELEAWRENGFS